jgi:GNAT superfamily N-acetyltransferase
VVDTTLEAAGGACFEVLYAIYRESIPVREQKSKAELFTMVSSPGYRFLLSQEHNTVTAFSILFVSAAENFCLLEYMAVDPKWRGRGVGSKLFEETVKSVHREHDGMPILIEVDADRECCAEGGARRRRQRFYRRLGCRRIADCAYILPLPGEGAPPEMDLWVYAPERRPTIHRARLERWLQIIYRDVYGCSPNDGRIPIMLQRLPDSIELV